MTDADSGVMPIATVDARSSFVDFFVISFINGILEHCLAKAS